MTALHWAFLSHPPARPPARPPASPPARELSQTPSPPGQRPRRHSTTPGAGRAAADRLRYSSSTAVRSTWCIAQACQQSAGRAHGPRPHSAQVRLQVAVAAGQCCVVFLAARPRGQGHGVLSLQVAPSPSPASQPAGQPPHSRSGRTCGRASPLPANPRPLAPRPGTPHLPVRWQRAALTRTRTAPATARKREGGRAVAGCWELRRTQKRRGCCLHVNRGHGVCLPACLPVAKMQCRRTVHGPSMACVRTCSGDWPWQRRGEAPWCSTDQPTHRVVSRVSDPAPREDVGDALDLGRPPVAAQRLRQLLGPPPGQRDKAQGQGQGQGRWAVRKRGLGGGGKEVACVLRWWCEAGARGGTHTYRPGGRGAAEHACCKQGRGQCGSLRAQGAPFPQYAGRSPPLSFTRPCQQSIRATPRPSALPLPSPL